MKLTAKLPEGEANGLTTVERQMVDRPDQFVTVVAVIDTHKITTDIDTGDVEPTVRIVKVEALIHDLDIKDARRLLDAAHARRTGRQTLDLATAAGVMLGATSDGIDSVSISHGGQTIDDLEQRGVLGPANGTMTRDVLVTTDDLPGLLDALDDGQLTEDGVDAKTGEVRAS